MSLAQPPDLRMPSSLLYVLKSCSKAVMGSLLLLISLQTVCRKYSNTDFMSGIMKTLQQAKGICVCAAEKLSAAYGLVQPVPQLRGQGDLWTHTQGKGKRGKSREMGLKT